MRRAPSAPLSALDRAVELARAEPWAASLACAAPTLVMTWLCLLVYYFEWVEGVRALRPGFALAFALAYVARALLLARYSGRLVDRMLVPVGGRARHAPAHVPLRVAVLMGAELWLWLWLLVLALRIDAWLLPPALLLLTLRGAVLPSWLAASDGSPELTVRAALRHALHAARGRRSTNVAAELLLLLSGFVLALNLGALAFLAISLAEDALGLELSFLRAFISPRNHFALILIAGLAASVLEPLRAALSAVLYAEYRLAEEAIELSALVERCIARGSSAAGAMLLALCALSFGARAHAQADSVEDFQPRHTLSPSDECDDTCREARARDDALLVDLVSILERSEFRDFPDRRLRASEREQVSFEHWLLRFLGWLGGHSTEARAEPLRTGNVAHLRLGALLAALLVLGLFGFAYGALRRRTQPVRRSVRERETPSAPSPARFVERSNDPPRDARAELHRLYRVGLLGLAQRGLLTLVASATNGQYLKALPSARERALLAELTGLFERSCYGAAVPSDSELARARTLASALCAEGIS